MLSINHKPSASTVFAGLRTYALCNRNKWAFFVVFGLSGVQVVTNLVSVIISILRRMVPLNSVPLNQVIFIKEPIEFAVATPTNICDANIPFSGAQELG